MIGAVNRVSPVPMIQRSATTVRAPAEKARRPRAQDDEAAAIVPESIRHAEAAAMGTLLASLASAPSGIRDMVAHILQEAERKLIRLKAEARAAAASGDRKAARHIARELAVVARQIADAAQDYAVGEAQPDFVSPALAKAAARIAAAGPVNAEALVGDVAAAAAEAAQVASGEPDTDRPEPAEADGESRQLQQKADRGLEPGSVPPPGSAGAQDEDILVKAHRLFEAAVDLLRAMEALSSRRPARADQTEPVDPIRLPLRPVGCTAVTANGVQQAGNVALPVARYGR